jgi:beta-aspartyl-peptidase (threonine type)
MPDPQQTWTLVIHGGAGVLERARMTAELEAKHRAGLDAALGAGASVLASGGSALDAVEAAARSLEDNPLFNAGHGAVLTYDGETELDAAIMDGRTRDAGAVTGVSATKNPISLARAVMERART